MSPQSWTMFTPGPQSHTRHVQDKHRTCPMSIMKPTGQTRTHAYRRVRCPAMMSTKIATNQQSHGAANSAQSRGADREAPSQSLRLFCAVKSFPWCADQESCSQLKSLHDLLRFLDLLIDLRAIDIGHFVCWQDADMRCPGVFWHHIIDPASQRQSASQRRSEHCLLLSFGHPRSRGIIVPQIDPLHERDPRKCTENY